MGWFKEIEHAWGFELDEVPIPEQRCKVFNGRVKRLQRKKIKRAQTRIKKLQQKLRNSPDKDLERQLEENQEKAKLNTDEIARELSKIDYRGMV